MVVQMVEFLTLLLKSQSSNPAGVFGFFCLLKHQLKKAKVLVAFLTQVV